MRPEAIYENPTWFTGLLLVAAAVAAAVVLQLVMHRIAPLGFRRRHNDVAIAIFSIIGVTYAVLLAFIAMVTWESFNRARAATFDEAGAVAELYRDTLGMPAALGAALRADLTGYVQAVVEAEWPAQTLGVIDPTGDRWLGRLHAAIGADAATDGVESVARAQFLQELSRLNAARQGRLLATAATVPTIVWLVLLAGGGLLIGFSAILGAESFGLHLLMTASLAASGGLVIAVIVSLNHPFRSEFSISPEAFRMQASEMVVAPPADGPGR